MQNMNTQSNSNDQKVDAAKSSHAGSYWFFGIITLFGLGFSGLHIYIWMKADSMKTWPFVTGKIVSSDIVSYREGSIEEKVGINRRTKFSAKVAYEYEFQGKTFKGDKISLFSKGHHQDEAQGVGAQYPLGSAVEVYVNPAHPEEAILEIGGSTEARNLVIAGGIIILIGLGGLAFDRGK
jgi:hypothetical protein